MVATARAPYRTCAATAIPTYGVADGDSAARFVEVMMSPVPMSLFYLLQLLTLFVSELGAHLAMRVGNDLDELVDPCLSEYLAVEQLSCR